MDNPNLSNLENIIKTLNEQIRHEMTDLTQKQGQLRSIDAEDATIKTEIARHDQELKKDAELLAKHNEEIRKHNEEIKKHTDEIKKLQTEVQTITASTVQIKQQITLAERKMENNKGAHNKLHQEIDTLNRKHSQNVTALSQTQQDYARSSSAKKPPMKLK